VGAVTLLVTFVAVFLAYNANSGLPFVPTYDLKAQLPTGSKLVKGNDVRVGGFRVGFVERLRPGVSDAGKAVAIVHLKLDKKVEPLADDTTARVRPRSPLGIKFVELTPGHGTKDLAPGDTLGLGQTSAALEFEDVYDAFPPSTREDVRGATEGLGDGLAGRGESLNESVAASAPLLRRLTPVMATLSNRRTRLGRLVRQLGAATAQVAPVAPAAAAALGNGADTFAALDRDPVALAAAIERLPGTLAQGTTSLRASRGFLDDTTELARRLRTPSAELTSTLPPIGSVLKTGTPVLSRSIPLSRDLADASEEVRELIRNPNTLMSLRDLRTALRILRPAIEYIAPYQTVCNYANYFIGPLGEHQSQPAAGGTNEQQFLKIINYLQPNSIAFTTNSRPADVAPDQKPQGATVAGQAAVRLFGPPYQPAIDAQGNADCQNGQDGYPNGRLIEPFARSRPDTVGLLADGTPAGGNAIISRSDFPGLAGGTYKARELGIENLKDVP
jgi:virulence factor Mce-like protein